MEKKVIIFEAGRTAYSVSDVADCERTTMTVGTLMGYLEDLDEDDLVIISHDNGYTFGSLRYEDEGSVNEFE